MKNISGRRIIIPFLVVAFLLLGCQQQENIGQIQQPIQTQQQTNSEETQQLITGVLKLESGATMKIPAGWSVAPYVSDPQFKNYGVNAAGETAWLMEYHVAEWLKGPNPDEGYVIPHEERPKALGLLKDIYDHQVVTKDARQQLDNTAGEFFGYGNLYRSAVTYVANNDKSYRGISFYNLQGQDASLYPVYSITLYNPDNGSIIVGSFGINDKFKEVADANKWLMKADSNASDTQGKYDDIGKLDREAHEGFKKLVETTARNNLSFGSNLDQLDKFFQSVSSSANNEFRVEELKVGATSQGMKLKSIGPFRKEMLNEIPFGDTNFAATFTGNKTLTGTYNYYGDDEAFLADMVCFTSDENSLKILPQVQGQSQPDFCFSNQDLAKKSFGPKGSSGKAKIEVDEYDMVGYPAEGSYSADLVKIVQNS